MKLHFHKSLIIPFTRRILYFLSAFVTLYVFLWELIEVDIPVMVMACLGYVLIEAYFYDPDRPFIPAIVTKSK